MNDSKTAHRIPGYDLARFLAIYGIVVVDMVLQVALDLRGIAMLADGPEPLMWMHQMWWGRASAMLSVMAGTGLALMFRLSDDEDAVRRKRRVVLRRALFLLVAGHLWHSSTLWEFSILHYYPFLLAFGMLFTKARPRTLLISAFLCMAVAVVFQLANPDPQWNFDEPSVDGSPAAEATIPADGEIDDDFDFSDFGTPKIWQARFWNPWTHFIDVTLDGIYPVFPFLAFLLFGICLVRVGIDDATIRRRILAGAVVVLAASIATWWLVKSGTQSLELETLFTIDRSPPMPLYIISAASQATILLCLCLSIAGLPSSGRWTAPLIATGQMTFSIYIVRTFVGGGSRQGLFDILGFPPGQGVVAGWTRVAIFFSITIICCHFWKKRFGRGPLEAAMRWFSDKPRRQP